jgi:uncharacterized short protein YbdD (DUF466 family)
MKPTWYFITSENSYAVAYAISPEEAIKEIPGIKKIKRAYPLNGFYLYEAFLAHDRQFHTGKPDMSDQEDRLSFYTFCAGYFLETSNNINGKIQWQDDLH